MYQDQFIQAIHDRKKLNITFFSQEDNAIITRKCAPFDYGTGTNIKDHEKRFWVWDYESDKSPHVLPLQSKNIKSMVTLDETFHPKDIVDNEWYNNPGFQWKIGRDWGEYS